MSKAGLIENIARFHSSQWTTWPKKVVTSLPGDFGLHFLFVLFPHRPSEAVCIGTLYEAEKKDVLLAVKSEFRNTAEG